MTDMLVKLYDDDDRQRNALNIEASLLQADIQIKRALAIDTQVIKKFIELHFNAICPGWVDECVATLYRHPTTCFIASHHGNVVGFACYDATAKGMVGPVGVDSAFRKRGIASVLLNACFGAMKSDGYAYAVIGWVSSEAFYQKTCGAVSIADSFPGIYSRMVMEHD